MLKVRKNEKTKTQNLRKNEKGITLITLVITIVILIILASISITTLLGDNGIISQAQQVKGQQVIENEKEHIRIAMIEAIGTSKFGNLEKAKMQNILDRNIGLNKTKAIVHGDGMVIQFIDTNRDYEININGDIKGPDKYEFAKDTCPGDITKDIYGNDLLGTVNSPYEINCIEDLCGFSNAVNNGNKFESKHIVLNRNLNFKSEFSYINGNISTTGKIESCDSVLELMDKLTSISYRGFEPIGNVNSNYFGGRFDGQNYKIENLYENISEIERRRADVLDYLGM